MMVQPQRTGVMLETTLYSLAIHGATMIQVYTNSELGS